MTFSVIAIRLRAILWADGLCYQKLRICLQEGCELMFLPFEIRLGLLRGGGESQKWAC
jgi:hypothetical protein